MVKKSMGQDDLQIILLNEPSTEVFPEVGDWEKARGKTQDKGVEDGDVLVVSPSRFSPLQDIDEEEEIRARKGVVEECAKDVEEGEILEYKQEEKHLQQAQESNRGKKPVIGASHKPSRARVVRSKDLLYGNKQENSKKSSVRKI